MSNYSAGALTSAFSVIDRDSLMVPGYNKSVNTVRFSVIATESLTFVSPNCKLLTKFSETVRALLTEIAPNYELFLPKFSETVRALLTEIPPN